MHITCPKCGQPHDDLDRFCPGCGHATAATSTGGRTVLMSSTQTPSPTTMSRTRMRNFDARTVIDRARRTFGSDQTSIGPRTMLMEGSDQREHLFGVIDISGSMGELFERGVIKLDAARNALSAMLVNKASIDPSDEAGLITFESSAQVIQALQPLSSSKRLLLQALSGLRPTGGTDINDGLVMALNHFRWKKAGVVRRIVLLTDGHGGNPLKSAKKLKSRGVIIDVIGIGPTPDAVDEPLLRKVASTVQGELRYRFIKDQTTLIGYYTQLGGKTATNG